MLKINLKIFEKNTWHYDWFGVYILGENKEDWSFTWFEVFFDNQFIILAVF